ncbi:MAG: stage II sporulation protein M [Firmicutes bacterium]|nr:stage II sporulation protein M [Bacillota bacterium]
MTKNFLAVIRENRSWIILAFLFFLGGLVLSYSALTQEPGIISILEENLLAALKDLGEEIFNVSALEGVMLLIINNIFATAQIIFLGIFLGVPTLISAIANGSVLGILAFQLTQEGIAPVPFILAGVLPHGIFELPAFFLSVALGLKLGYHIVFPLPNLSRKDSLRLILHEIRISMPFIIGLLLVAAFIEIFITPLFLSSFTGLI